MKKQDISRMIAKRANISLEQGGEVLNLILDEIALALSRGDTVSLPNFGSFQPSDRQARMGTNPTNGEPMEIPATRSVRFKAGKGLKDAAMANDNKSGSGD